MCHIESSGSDRYGAEWRGILRGVTHRQDLLSGQLIVGGILIVLGTAVRRVHFQFGFLRRYRSRR